MLSLNQVPAVEHALLIGVRARLDALLRQRIDAPLMRLSEAGVELIRVVGEVLAAN